MAQSVPLQQWPAAGGQENLPSGSSAVPPLPAQSEVQAELLQLKQAVIDLERQNDAWKAGVSEGL